MKQGVIPMTNTIANGIPIFLIITLFFINCVLIASDIISSINKRIERNKINFKIKNFVPLNKAEALFFSYLTENQKRTYLQDINPYIIVKGNVTKTHYRIWTSNYSSGNINAINENEYKRGKILSTKSYCLVSRYPVPIWDTFLAQKLMIECDEERFLKIAF